MTVMHWKYIFICRLPADEKYRNKRTCSVLSEAVITTRNSFTRNKNIEMRESSIVGNETMSRYLRISLLQAAFKKLFKPLKQCGGISIKTKIGVRSELCCFAVIVSYCFDLHEGKNSLTVSRGSLTRNSCVRSFAFLANVRWLQMARCHTVQYSE